MSDKKSMLAGIDDQNHLLRVLKLRHLVIYGIAFMTPIAPAFVYGFVTTSSGGMMALAYIVAMIAMLFTASSYEKMASAFPYAGSTYSYSQEAIHPNAGFVAGWAMYMDYVLVPLIVLIIGATYCTVVFPAVPYWFWVLSMGLFIFVVNYLGISVAAMVNNILVLYMCVVVILFLIFGVSSILGGTGAGTLVSSKPFYNPDTFIFKSIFSAAALCCFSFIGFDSITTLAEEAVNPRKDIGRAAMLACLGGGLIFIIQAYIAQLAWPDYTTFTDLDTAFFEVIKLVSGPGVSIMFTGAIIVSSITAGLAGQASAARVMYAMGRDGRLPRKFFAYIHPRFKTPTNNITVMAVFGMVGAFLLKLEFVAELMSFGALVGFMFVNLSVVFYFFIKKREYKIFRNLILPALGFLICGYLWISLAPSTLKIGLIWMAIGGLYCLILSKGFKEQITVYNDGGEST